MSKLFSNLPYWALIGWVGFLATLGMLISLFADWGVVVGWIGVFSTTIFFYVSTIEAEYVETEWASFITIPSGIVLIFAGSEPINYLVWILGPAFLIYGILEYIAPRYPWLAEKLHTSERRAAAAKRRTDKIAKNRAEQLAFNQLEYPGNDNLP